MKTLKNIDEYHKVFGFPIIDCYRRLGFDFNKEPYDTLANEWVKSYDELCCKSELCEGVFEVIKDFDNKGIKQVVVSMEEESRLVKTLKRLDIYNYFNDVIGLDNVYAESKIELAKKWFENYNDKNSVIIGDTDHDFFVSKELGIDCILVCSGHQSRETLEKDVYKRQM